MSSKLTPLLAVGFLGALGYAASQAKPPPTTTEVPESVLARMAGAIGSGDPKELRAEAARLRSEGFPLQAQDLERVADEIEATRR